MNLYRNVLKQSWRITWRYKFLWFFGFLASFWSIGSAYEIFYKSISLGDRDTMLITLWKDLAMSGLTFGKIGEAIINAPLSALSALLFIILGLLLFLFFSWIFTCGQISLIKAVDAIETKKQTFGGLFFESKKHFWPVFGVNFLGKVLTSFCLMLVSYPILAPLLAPTFTLGNFLLFLIFFILTFVLALLIGIVTIYAGVYIVLKKYSFVKAIEESWKLFVQNWLVSIETAFLLFLLSIVVGIALVFVLSVLFLPFVFLFVLAQNLRNVFLFWLIVVLAALTMIALFFLTLAFLTTLQISIWVTLFERLESGEAKSKLQRWADNTLGRW